LTAASEGRGPVRRQVVAEEVVARITTLIAGGELAVGDKLPPERVLARELRISRPTLREGIRALAAVGIVRVKHGKGVFVAATPSDVGAHADSAGIAPAALPRLRALLFAATLSLAALRLGQASLDAIVERLASAASDDSTPGDGGRALVEGLVRLLDEPDLAPLIDLLWPGSGVPPEAGPLVDDELPRALAGRNAGRAFELAFRAFVPGPASHGS
jgi:DNA-binding transcriptional regulator YhcF (GntR family)